VPYSLHMLNYQKNLLESYLKNPEIHVKSSNNPKLLCGLFVNIPAHRALKSLNCWRGWKTNTVRNCNWRET